MTQCVDIAVIGGGAAGFFGACIAAEYGTEKKICIFEAHKSRVLAKVAVSGGGRCNLTHACFNARELSAFYPRGKKALISVFKRFGPEQTMEWFSKRGARLKTQADGRVFPVSNDSATIINTLRLTASRLGVEVVNAKKACCARKTEGGFVVEFEDGTKVCAAELIIATGSGPGGFELARELGHNIVEPVPALFAFDCDKDFVDALAGVSVEDVELSCGFGREKSRGGLLFTACGVTGPSVLELSSRFARPMAKAGYVFEFNVNWLPGKRQPEVMEEFNRLKTQSAARLVANSPLWGILPKRVWSRLLTRAGIGETTAWKDFSRRNAENLAGQLLRCGVGVVAKATHKSEFVTCGGVELGQVDFKTMRSRVCDGLFFAGEVLDIDGFTGGFNFQNAWSTSWIAGFYAACGA